MTNSTKLARLALPAAVVAVGIAGAAVLGGVRERHTVTIPSGATFIAALDQTVSTERSSGGDHITLQVIEPIRLEAETQLSGVTLRGEVTHVKGGGRIAGAPELDLRITEMEVDGRTYLVSTEPFHVEGKNDAKESALEIGGGAVVGGVLRGAKGAIVGAAIGTGVAVATKGDQLILAKGQHLRIRLTQAVEVQL